MLTVSKRISFFGAKFLPVLFLAACGNGDEVAATSAQDLPPLEQATAEPTRDPLPLTLDAGNRSLTKLPLIIAWDRGLFEKHGLDMNLLIPASDFEGGKEIPADRPDADPEAWFRGGTPMLLRAAQAPEEPHWIDIGSTDCAVRSHIVGRRGIDLEITSLEDLKGRRIGVSGIINTLGFQARLLAQRMGWDYQTDITLVEVENDGLEELEAETVDVILVNEIAYTMAKAGGFPVLFNTGDWSEEIAGNSVAVDPIWFQDPVNREKSRRLMMAIAEAISIFHNEPMEVRRILREWNGVQNEDVAQDIMDAGAWLPRKPYACVAGLEKTIELFPEIVQGRVTAEEFYDNLVMDDLESSGFLDALYN